MERWLPLALFGIAMGGLMVLLARYQARRYQDYLERHTAETAKLVAQQGDTLAAVAAQTAALERIAAALERERA